MNVNRDDTLPRADSVLSHFKRNLECEIMALFRKEFKRSWDIAVKIKNPLEFKVEVWFDRVLPEYIVKAIRSELAFHGWTNIFLDLKAKSEGSEMNHYLLVKLDHNTVTEYV